MDNINNTLINISNLKQYSVFKSLTNSELEELIQENNCNSYKKGQIIYHEGNRVKGFYCVYSGIIKIFKTGIEGKEQIIRFAKAGDIIGYRSVLSGENVCTSAKVNEDALLCFIKSDALFSLLRKNPQFAIDLLKLVSNELGEANVFITEIAQKSVKERLAETIIYLKDSFGIDKENYLNIIITREELANIIGTATESVIRLLSDFKNEKLIEIKGRKIKLLNIGALQKIASIYDRS
ncbi:MAG: Crp/Fnr family transcriptional regulator [Bacteroidetes bacterium GWA2_30_7]|nr:MAG: Crp/Fnr family transcriptional regulator [Bacteroidetes bacterium GWA2_30_7]